MSKKSAQAAHEQRFVDPVVEAYKPGIDRTLIRENLKLTPQQRLEQLEALMRGIDAMNRAGRSARRAS